MLMQHVRRERCIRVQSGNNKQNSETLMALCDLCPHYFPIYPEMLLFVYHPQPAWGSMFNQNIVNALSFPHPTSLPHFLSPLPLLSQFNSVYFIDMESQHLHCKCIHIAMVKDRNMLDCL